MEFLLASAHLEVVDVVGGIDRPWHRPGAGGARLSRPARPLVDVSGVSFRYGQGEPRLIDISLRLRSGDFCVMLGPTGAGKSTLLRCLLRVLRPDRGTIRVAGADVADMSTRLIGRVIAYVPQIVPAAPGLTALDVAVLGRGPHLPPSVPPSVADRRASLEVLGGLGIDQLATRQFADLSAGERQLVMIARALIQETPVLVLDEPTTALDYAHEVRILGMLAEHAAQGRAILLTSQRPDHALGYATRALLMREGALLAEGIPHKVITSASMTDLYGTPIHVTGVNLPGADTRVARTCIPVQQAHG